MLRSTCLCQPLLSWDAVTGQLHREVTIGALPDTALLDMFAFYMHGADFLEQWHVLVHVCQRWRYLVFASPRRLDLRLLCRGTTPVREMLDFWPALRIAILSNHAESKSHKYADNITAALENNDRVWAIHLFDVPTLQLEIFAGVMRKPFPELTLLELHANAKNESTAQAPVLPDSFLNGSAPRLHTLSLDFVLFPALPKLLLTSSNLNCLVLLNIPHSGYISPEAIVTCLSSLTRLQTLHLGFRSPRSRPDQTDQTSRRRPLFTRTVLPALTDIWFLGSSEYLEDFVDRIDAPQLYFVWIMFFNQLIFNITQLPRFISRTENLKALNQVKVDFLSHSARVVLSRPTETVNCPELTVGISCTVSEWQLSSLAQICSSWPPSPISLLERLDIILGDQDTRPHWQNDIENTQWLELLHPFASVKNLYVSEELGLYLVPALQEITRERVIEVLSVLQGLFLEGLQSLGPVHDAAEHFVATRRLSGHPVVVHRWERG